MGGFGWVEKWEDCGEVWSKEIIFRLLVFLGFSLKSKEEFKADKISPLLTKPRTLPHLTHGGNTRFSTLVASRTKMKHIIAWIKKIGFNIHLHNRFAA